MNPDPENPLVPRPHTPAALLTAVLSRCAGRLVAGSETVEVTGITHDSRAVRSGDLYVAVPGARFHGAQFAQEAAAAGALAILTDAAGLASAHSTGLAVIEVLDVRAVMGDVAALVYSDPARDLTMVGITGTNGKTTTAYMVEAILRAAGHHTGLIGTVETRIDDAVMPSVRTTPEATDVHALLAVMRERGVDSVVMEVSSHALVLGRVDGIVFDVAAFTNLTQDHLDFHTDMQNYFEAKASLFEPARAKRAVIAIDDEWSRELIAQVSIPAIAVSGDQHDHVHLQIPGAFNHQNAAVALGIAATLGVDRDLARSALAALAGVPGRMEVVRAADPLAVVDYAHTPDAVARVLDGVRRSVSGRVIAVVGCGGDRDAAKRPLMGAAAATRAEIIIVTDDNPRSEQPEAIRAAVLSGARDAALDSTVDIRDVGDRRSAIAMAVEIAEAGDAIAVLGKGHEQGQEVDGVVLPFDDRQELKAALDAKVSRS